MLLLPAVLIFGIPKSTRYELVLESRIPLLFPAIGPNGFDLLVIRCRIIVSITNERLSSICKEDSEGDPNHVT